MMDLDAALQALGQFGSFQIYILSLLLFPVVLSSFRYAEYVFTTMNIPHRCRIPGCDPEGPAPFSPLWLKDAVPLAEDNSPYECLRYGGTLGYNSSCTADMFTNITQTCDSWVFEEPTVTIAHSFDILCPGDYWKLTFLSSISVFTGFLGEPLSGIVSDKIGRKTILIYGCIYMCAAGLVRSFSPTYSMLAVIEGIDGLVSGAIFSPAYLLGLETLSPNKRLLGSMLMHMYWTVGGVVLACIMWLVQDWRYLQRLFYTPMLIISILLYWYLPESVRWLHTRGKSEEVKHVFVKIAKFNNTENNLSKIVENFHGLGSTEKRDKKSESEKSEGLRLEAVMKSRTVLWRVVACALLWTFTIYVLWCLNQGATYFGDNQYLSFLLVSVIEIPAYVVSLWIPDWSWLGRKGTMVATFVLGGVASLAIAFVRPDQVALNFFLYMVGKFCLTLSFTVITLYAAEMFPTEIRHSLLAFCSMTSRVGLISAQQTRLIDAYINPMFVVSLVSFTGAALTLTCPETLGTDLPDTIEQAESIGRDNKSSHQESNTKY